MLKLDKIKKNQIIDKLEINKGTHPFVIKAR